MPDITIKLTDEEYSLVVQFAKTTGMDLTEIVQESIRSCVARANEFLSDHRVQRPQKRLLHKSTYMRNRSPQNTENRIAFP